MAKKTKRLDKKGETPSRLELTQEEQRLLRRVQTAYPDRSLYEAFSLFEKERDYKMSPALKKYVKTKKGDSKKYGVGMMSGGMAKKKNPNEGIAELRKVAPQAVKRMGFRHGGMANCGASMKPGQKSSRGK